MGPDTVTAALLALGQMIEDLREDSGRGATRQISLAITKLEEAEDRLIRAKKEQG